MSDSLIQFGGAETKQFYHLHGTENEVDFDNSAGELLTIYIQQDPVEDFHNRKVYSLLDFTGQLGGVFEVLNILGSFIVGKLAKRSFLYSLFNKLYSVQLGSLKPNQRILSNIKPAKVRSTILRK